MSSTDAIFLLAGDGKLERVAHSTYSSEDVLQQLIASYPELLAGDQIDPDDPPRWLLVSREAGVPDNTDTADRWSLDHLLLDQNAIPTLVEVKRSSDTRIRREVVGQMLDYAANATRFWPVDRIRSLAATQYGGVEGLDQRVRELLGPGAGADAVIDVEVYWKTVEENLRAGKLRLLFVADELPRELRRVIEFLNEHMPSIEVLGIEVRYYENKGEGGHVQALVPRVVGQSERAREHKNPSSAPKKTTEAAFLAFCPPAARTFFEDALKNARAEGLGISWGSKGFSVRAILLLGQPVTVLLAYMPGVLGDVPLLDVYVRDLENAEAAKLRASLLGLGAFRERGKFTVSVSLTEATLPQARDALPMVWEVARRIQEAAP